MVGIDNLTHTQASQSHTQVVGLANLPPDNLKPRMQSFLSIHDFPTLKFKQFTFNFNAFELREGLLGMLVIGDEGQEGYHLAASGCSCGTPRGSAWDASRLSVCNGGFHVKETMQGQARFLFEIMVADLNFINLKPTMHVRSCSFSAASNAWHEALSSHSALHGAM